MTTVTPSLETIPGKDLLTRPIEPLSFTIADILPHGVFILAGSPKAGKSWLALDICHAVANGSSLWQHAASQGDVLYLALEDNPARLQERLGKVSSEDDLNASTDIHFATHAKRLGGGLAEQLNEFLDAYPRTKLIVIDTLQYIRNTGRFTGTYAGDYHDMDALRDIVTGRNITLLLVTHTRKTGDADPLNLVSGSTGLAGAVDGLFILEKHKRSGSMARLTIANRDTAGHQYELRFDGFDCRWQFIREIHDDEDSGEDDSFCDLLGCLLDENLTWNGTATQLCDALSALDPEFTLSPIALAKSLKHRQGALKTPARHPLHLHPQQRRPVHPTVARNQWNRGSGVVGRSGEQAQQKDVLLPIFACWAAPKPAFTKGGTQRMSEPNRKRDTQLIVRVTRKERETILSKMKQSGITIEHHHYIYQHLDN